jgi:hypothetical protein
VHDSLIEGGSQATLVALSEVLIRGSHLLNSGVAPTVLGFGGASKIVDIRHNWWGTTDTTQIENWIIDEQETVLWNPIADMPLPNEEQSMGEFKGQYRN